MQDVLEILFPNPVCEIENFCIYIFVLFIFIYFSFNLINYIIPISVSLDFFYIVYFRKIARN